MRESEKPFNAAFSNSERYTPGKSPQECQVMLDGAVLPGIVLGRNGPRTQVRFWRGDAAYVRWFDTEEVMVAEEPPDDAA